MLRVWDKTDFNPQCHPRGDEQGHVNSIANEDDRFFKGFTIPPAALRVRCRTLSSLFTLTAATLASNNAHFFGQATNHIKGPAMDRISGLQV
jgi:hypothetical protein